MRLDHLLSKENRLAMEAEAKIADLNPLVDDEYSLDDLLFSFERPISLKPKRLKSEPKKVQEIHNFIKLILVKNSLFFENCIEIREV